MLLNEPITLSVKEVLSQNFYVLNKNIGSFIGYGLVVAVVEVAIMLCIFYFLGNGSSLWVGLGLFFIFFSFSASSFFYIYFILSKSLNTLKNTENSSASLILEILSNFLPLLGLSSLLALLFIMGMSMLIIPGLLVIMIAYVALPVRLNEGKTITGAISRSAELTKGNRLKILSLVIIPFIPAFLAMPILILSSVTSTIIYLLFCGYIFLYVINLMAVTYHQLHDAKEGSSLKEIMDVFA